MKDPFLKVKYDKLVFELKFLEADLHYHNSILEKGSAEFNTQCRAAIKERGLEEVFYGEKSPAEQHAKRQVQEGKRKKKKPSSDTEKLFKKIASITHPDKLVGLSDEESSMKRELFVEAKDAKDDDNLLKLHLIAADLGVEIPEMSLENLLLFENKISEMKSEINSKKSTWMWNWLIASPDKRSELIGDYVSFMIQTIAKDASQNTE